MDPSRDPVDVIVVGSGAAGMTAALAAAHQGLDVIVVEKGDCFGGSTARSGGGVWIPNNYALERAGVADTAEDARSYLEAIVGDVVPADRRNAFLDHGPEALAFVRDHTPLDFMWVPGYSDYYPEAPGGRACGRSVEPRPLDGNIVGSSELSRLHPPYLKAPAGMVVTQANYRWMSLAMRNIRGPVTALRIALLRLVNMVLRRPMLSMGQALAVGLRAGLNDAGVPLWYNSELTGLRLTDGRVTGVDLIRDGEPVTVQARRAVIVASGGFEKNAEMREKWQASPITADWTTGAASNTGGGIAAGVTAGADVALMDDAWWGPTIPLTGGPYFCLAERNLPGSIMVNSEGRRFVNEAAPYVDAVRAMYDGEAAGISHIPSWMILDQRYRNRYLFAGLGPRQPFPGRWYKHGTLFRGDSVEGLGQQIGMPADALADTVDRFNTMARSGVDTDFHRGESAYDHYYSDPRVKPNPSLGPIDLAPFYAVKIVPGDLGTKGGLVTDSHARVLRPDGSVIEGLYAAGNASAAVMGHTYPGAGGTIGPAMVFGYIAALDIAAPHIAKGK